MLSSAKIGRSSWRYYQRTVAGGACDYYTEHGDRPGRWQGTGLSDLGLTSGSVVEERELEALFGRALSPTTGRPLGAVWRTDAVTGYDLTFSAPKSVSALWALGDPKTVNEIDAAHAAAVDAALGYLETHASLSRRGKDGVDQIASTGFAAALFDHRTSRTGDPQLHTHALVVNKVLCSDGVWRALDGHEVYHHKKSAGAIYQAALRAELTVRVPVVFGPVSEHGQAEIAGIPEELMSAWSTRTTAVLADAVPTIAAAEDALGRPVTSVERARIIKTAILSTRPPKEADVPEASLRGRWQEQAAALGWDGHRMLLSARLERLGPDPRRTIREGWLKQLAVEAVTAMGRSKAIWSRSDLAVQVAARIPTDGPTTPATAAQAAALVEQLTGRALTDDGCGAVPLGVDPTGSTTRASDDRFASRELVDTEARILERAISAGFLPPSRLPDQVIEWFYQGPSALLSEEQRTAAVWLVASRDQVTVMTAPAGAGKTTTLAAAIDVWGRCQRQVVALAPSARAAAELSSATGAPGQTVARWLLHQDTLDGVSPARPAPGRLRPRSVVIVDEASMLSTADLDQLTARVAHAGARLVLVGDPSQIGAVNAPGGMFEHLTHTMATLTIELTELHRFTHAWEGAATLRLRDGDPSVLADYVAHGRVHPAPTSQDAADAVFDQWRHATDAGRDALMLARAWTDVTALNARARAVGVATGAITGPTLATITSRTASTRGHPEQRTWRAGDILLAKKNTTRIPIGADTVRNGDRFRVLTTAPHGGGLVVSDLRGRGTTTLPLTYLARHAEYGWAATIDGAQGATADVGVVLARSGLDREHLYVAMSRGRDDNHVHTTPELTTGDAGPHHPAPAPRPPTGTPATAAPQPDGGPATASSQPPADLAASLSVLATAIATSGRERAAHSLLDPAVAAARERDWSERENQRPPRPVPADHLRHRLELGRANARLEQARDEVDRLGGRARDLQSELEAVSRWARSRRQELTAAIDFTNGTDLPWATNELHSAQGDVDVLTRLVDTDTRQRLTDDHAERERRQHTWLTRPERVYVDANTATAPADRLGRPASRGSGRRPSVLPPGPEPSRHVPSL